jgi:hypothetical protein
MLFDMDIIGYFMIMERHCLQLRISTVQSLSTTIQLENKVIEILHYLLNNLRHYRKYQTEDWNLGLALERHMIA